MEAFYDFPFISEEAFSCACVYVCVVQVFSQILSQKATAQMFPCLIFYFFTRLKVNGEKSLATEVWRADQCSSSGKVATRCPYDIMLLPTLWICMARFW